MTVLSSNQAEINRPVFLVRQWAAFTAWRLARHNPPITNQSELRAEINRQRGCEQGCYCSSCNRLFTDINRFEK